MEGCSPLVYILYEDVWAIRNVWMNRKVLCAKDVQQPNKTETFQYFCTDCTDVTKNRCETIYVCLVMIILYVLGECRLIEQNIKQATSLL